MKGHYTRRRVDSNQKQVVDGLRACGCKVLSLAPMGHGVPDLLVFRWGKFYLLEVKSPGGKLTADEEWFCDEWPVTVVRTVDEALEAVGL